MSEGQRSRSQPDQMSKFHLWGHFLTIVHQVMTVWIDLLVLVMVLQFWTKWGHKAKSVTRPYVVKSLAEASTTAVFQVLYSLWILYFKSFYSVIKIGWW